jgi:uncharacterized phage protein gp47/JayE
MNELPTLPDLVADYVRRVVSYTDEVTYFGDNSVALADAKATAELTQQSHALYRALLRRYTLIGAQGDDLTEVSEEYATPRLGPTHSRVLVIVRPHVASVTAITASSLLEVDDSSKFEAGDSIRIALSDGSLSEIVTISAITTATGPNGGDELDVGSIVQLYDPTTEDVKVLLRRTLSEGTVFTSTTGVSFESLEDLTIGDSNPVMLGESASLALADKVWCEAQEAGAAGNVEAGTITALQTADPDVRSVENPMRSHAGADTEPDYSLKYRTAHGPQIGAQETQAQLEALARRGNRDVLRAFAEDSDALSTIRIRVLTRSGGGLSANAAAALSAFMSQHLRSQLAVDVRAVEETAVEVEATIGLTPGPGTPAQRLERVWRLCADRLAGYLDWRKWPEAQSVDESQLLSIVRNTRGVASLVTSSFLPSADVDVAAASIPMFTRLVLRDLNSSATFGATLRTSY